ncbi:MAG: TerC family protein [Polyangiaceae bacterium]
MQPLAWGGFLLMIAVFLALDLGVFHKSNDTPTTKSALKWTGVWFCVAMAFNAVVYLLYKNQLLGLGGTASAPGLSGRDAAVYFFLGYIVEQSLSLDNIFVMALIFRFFKIPGELQHRVLFWGILGAVVLRITMILLGSVFIASFAWAIQIFGAILCYTAIKMALSKGDDDFDPEDSSIVKWTRKVLPFTSKMHGDKFFIRQDNRRLATPLLLVLVVVEGSDVVFAVDSIPAVFGIFETKPEPFIVFTSNIFAILGLRSLYFALASLLRQFAYLKYSLIVVLLFVGVKMLVAKWLHVSAPISLGVIVTALAAGVVVSQILKKDEEEEPEPSLPAPQDPKASAGSAPDSGAASPAPSSDDEPAPTEEVKS